MTLLNVFTLVGSLGLFLYGMKTMSEGLQLSAGSGLRNILGSITSNRFKGILTGMGITVLIQSSTVTTVMTVSFVNAGILSLLQAAGVIMGANIGTTLTAWLVDWFGFKVDLTPYTLAILAVAIPLTFFRSSKIKGISSGLIGLALLLMGLGFLKSSVPEISPDSGIVDFFLSVSKTKGLNVVFGALLGATITVLIQSSSATIALTMTLVVAGVIPFELGVAMVLGENFGTTVTAEFAAMVGNVYAKRAARIHLLFNLIGVTGVLLLFPFFMKLAVYLTTVVSGDPINNPALYGSTGLAVVHTTFNLINVLSQVWFTPALVRLAERTVRSKGEDDERFKLDYIGKGDVTSPNLSLLEVKREIAKFGDITARMAQFTRKLIIHTEKKERRDLFERMKKYEEITDQVEVEITNYLKQVGSRDMPSEVSKRIQGMNRIVSNLERIGDLFYQISKNIEKKDEDKLSFDERQYEGIGEMLDLIDKAFAVMNHNLQIHHWEVNLEEAQKVEEEINEKRDELRREHFEAEFKDDKSIKTGLLYSDIFSTLERIGDHIINVSEGVIGKI